MKKISITFMIVSAILILIGVFQIWDGKHKQTETLEMAKDIVEQRKENIVSEEQNNDIIGILTIPTLNEELPIIEGADESQLEKGVGHVQNTKLPGQNDQIVLSGHRDTVFKDLGKLKIQDQLIIKMPNGENKYTIYDTKIVDADDRTVIRSTAPEEILVLSTCYPFGYVGNAPKRYVIYAK